jgi:isopentenyl-diphosphate delta-isomerase
MEKIVLVDKNDNAIGEESKEKCHEKEGILHRAVSILIFNNKNEILITRRSRFKKLWPLYLDNSCSTHPTINETYEKCGERRLNEELGFICKLKVVSKFQYKVKYKNVGSENEICALLIGKYNGKIKPNTKEIDSYEWVNFEKLKGDISKNPEKYTPWLIIGLKKVHVPLF